MGCEGRVAACGRFAAACSVTFAHMRTTLLLLALSSSAAAQRSLVLQVEPHRPTAFFVIARAPTPGIRRSALPAELRTRWARYLEATDRISRRFRAAALEARHLDHGAREAHWLRLREEVAPLDARIRQLRTDALQHADGEGRPRLVRALLETGAAAERFLRASEAFDDALARGEDVEPPRPDYGDVLELAARAATELQGPLRAWARYLEGWCALESDDPTRATRAFTAALAVEPPAPIQIEAALRLGLLAGHERREVASRHFARALELADAMDVHAHDELATYMLAWTTREPGVAFDAARRLLARDVDDAIRRDVIHGLLPRVVRADSPLPDGLQPNEAASVRLATAERALERGEDHAVGEALDRARLADSSSDVLATVEAMTSRARRAVGEGPALRALRAHLHRCLDEHEAPPTFRVHLEGRRARVEGETPFSRCVSGAALGAATEPPIEVEVSVEVSR